MRIVSSSLSGDLWRTNRVAQECGRNVSLHSNCNSSITCSCHGFLHQIVVKELCFHWEQKVIVQKRAQSGPAWFHFLSRTGSVWTESADRKRPHPRYRSSTCKTNMTCGKQTASVSITSPVRERSGTPMLIIHRRSGNALPSNIYRPGGGKWRMKSL